MSRACRIKIKVANGPLVDLVERYDFHLIESPAMVIPPIRPYEVEAYPETSASLVDKRTVKMPFDYKITLGYWGSEEQANATIRSFFDSMFIKSGDVLTAQSVLLKNEWKNVQMVGLPKAWDGKTYKIDGENSLVTFDFTLYVSDPNTFTDVQPETVATKTAESKEVKK